MTKVTITFQVSDIVPNFDGAVGTANSVHEALCQAIHDGDQKALVYLGGEVLDITLVEG